jgi:hypothetical protein
MLGDADAVRFGHLGDRDTVLDGGFEIDVVGSDTGASLSDVTMKICPCPSRCWLSLQIFELASVAEGAMRQVLRATAPTRELTLVNPGKSAVG